MRLGWKAGARAKAPLKLLPPVPGPVMGAGGDMLLCVFSKDYRARVQGVWQSRGGCGEMREVAKEDSSLE